MSPNLPRHENTEEISPLPLLGPDDIRVKELEPLEWVAAIAGAALFLAIIGFLIWGMIEWTHIVAPELTTTLDETQAISNFKSVTDIETNRVAKVLDLVVTKTLLPVFTTVIGYLLGKRGTRGA